MARTSKSRMNATAGDQILVALRDEGDVQRGHGSLIGNLQRAERIVAALVEKGVEQEAVSALRVRELPLKITYRWDVEICGNEGAAPARSPALTPSKDRRRDGLLAGTAGLLRELLPEKPFQLRFDRVVWLSLWAVSLLLLGISVLTTLSKGSAREFVIDGPPSSFEVDARPSVQVDAPQATPEIEPGPTPNGAVVVGGVSAAPPCIAAGINNCQCQDFATQPEAQALFEAYPPAPGHIVDPDGNGAVCEWLPAGGP
jgi:hypothetical protein